MKRMSQPQIESINHILIHSYMPALDADRLRYVASTLQIIEHNSVSWVELKQISIFSIIRNEQ